MPPTEKPAIVVAALYKFAALDDYRELRDPLLQLLTDLAIKGTLLLAREGINGTVAGRRESIDALLASLRSDPRLADLKHKESFVEQQPFLRTKVKLKREIVTMGVAGIDPTNLAGTYVKPQQWNALITDPEVITIDTRNDYEYQLGTFKNALNPQTRSFREFPQWVSENLDPHQHKKVAMFCTGGIRCEKSTAYLREQGFEEVYHLEGGILNYLEAVPEDDTTWEGECFVFDDRVAVNHQLEKGSYELCHGCRHPIAEQDKQSPKYVQGVSCPRCHDQLSDTQRLRFSERQKQIELARQRGEGHLAVPMAARKAVKQQRKARQRHKSKS